MSSDQPPRPGQRVPSGIQWSKAPAEPTPLPEPTPKAAATVPAAVRAAQARVVASVPVEGGRPSLPPAGAPRIAPASVDPANVRVRAVASVPPPAPPRPAQPAEPDFFPLEPRSWEETGLDPGQVEGLVLRTMLGSRSETGRAIADAIGLPLSLVRDVLDRAKERKLVNYKGTTAVGDFVTELSDAGRDRAVQTRAQTTYVGTAPVPFDHYLEALKYQSLANKNPGIDDLRAAFADLFVNDEMFDRIGPAVTSGKAMFLHGEPGNGKTSLAERMTRCFGGTIWIPYTLDVGGHVVKLFDPAIHEEVAIDEKLHRGRFDRRWVRIERPTVIAGGELTLDMLEIQSDPVTHICEAPLQLKANAGTFVIDDFGRGNTKPRDLLNRWIFPLEKKVDFLSLPDGRKITCPFDCLLVFSTNLEPRDLADEAFLRRIPYKIYVGDPIEDEFEGLVVKMAEALQVELPPRSVKYLIERHYKMNKRPMRMCHPRDLLSQVVHLCEYERRPRVAGPQEWDRVVANYFGL